jgi:hypothetical protein
MDLVSEEEAEATMDLVSEMEVTCECFSGGGASPLEWLLNGSSRATPGLGKPLNEPDRDHDERTPGPRFSRVP